MALFCEETTPRVPSSARKKAGEPICAFGLADCEPSHLTDRIDCERFRVSHLLPSALGGHVQRVGATIVVVGERVVLGTVLVGAIDILDVGSDFAAVVEDFGFGGDGLIHAVDGGGELDLHGLLAGLRLRDLAVCGYELRTVAGRGPSNRLAQHSARQSPVICAGMASAAA